MNFDEYQKKVREFADYPSAMVNGNAVKLVYPVLGLVEEIGEAREKLRLVEEFDDLPHITAFMKELGDVCWFCAEIMTVLNLEADLSRFTDDNCDDYELAYPEISGILAKAVRDTSGIVSPEKVQVIKENIEIIIFTVSQMAEKVCFSDLESVMQMNYDKLLSRKKRGVIHGSGDDR